MGSRRAKGDMRRPFRMYYWTLNYPLVFYSNKQKLNLFIQIQTCNSRSKILVDKGFSTITGNLISKFETFDLRTIIAKFGRLYSTCDNTKCKCRGAGAFAPSKIKRLVKLLVAQTNIYQTYLKLSENYD